MLRGLPVKDKIAKSYVVSKPPRRCSGDYKPGGVCKAWGLVSIPPRRYSGDYSLENSMIK